jgi:hypothetical protein
MSPTVATDGFWAAPKWKMSLGKVWTQNKSAHCWVTLSHLRGSPEGYRVSMVVTKLIQYKVPSCFAMYKRWLIPQTCVLAPVVTGCSGPVTHFVCPGLPTLPVLVSLSTKPPPLSTLSALDKLLYGHLSDGVFNSDLQHLKRALRILS